jgi:hypothetical protein
MFPPTTLDKLQVLRKSFIADSEKAEEALERAENKVIAARNKVYQINEIIEAVKAGVDPGSGEVE